MVLFGLALLSQPAAGDNILVTNNNDVINGDTSNPAALIASNGGDGISLREALLAANNAVGPHTISFDPSLAGQTITLTTRFAPVMRDGITITGLTSNDQPNITLDPSGASNPGAIFFIAASSFSMSGLKFLSIPNGFNGLQIGGSGFGLQGQPTSAPGLLSNINISGNSFSNGDSNNNVFAIFLCHTVGTTSDATISNVVIADNTFTQLGESINIQSAGTSNKIQDVTIFGNKFSQNTVTATSAVELGSGGMNNLIQRVQILQNTFADNFQGIALNIGGTSSGNSIQNTQVARNFFSGNLGAMIAVAGVDPTTSNNLISNVQVVNNVVELLGWQGGGSGMILVTDNQNGGTNNTVNGVSLVNNTIYSNGSPGTPGSGVWVTSSGGVSNVTVLNTIFWGITGTVFNGVSPSQVSYSIVNQSGFTGLNHNFSSDPLFVNPSSNDFHLQSGSPAIGAGLSTGAPTGDSDCQTRSNPPSVGAYEFEGPNTCASEPQTLLITPASNIASSGNQGGPFLPPSFDYSLSTSSDSVGYSISGVPSWLDVSSSSGNATTTPIIVTFTVNAGANSLSGGVYGPVTITFTNTTNGQGTQTRMAALTVTAPQSLVVTPATNTASSGNQGGIFSPASFQYQLGASSSTVTYSITGLPAWLDASATAGTVTTSPTPITFSINSNAKGLSPGTYRATVSFNNTLNGQGNQTRMATLTVNPVGANGGGLSEIYVSARTGTDAGDCSVTAPCASLNYALSITDAGGEVTILDGGVFGPVTLNQGVTINGSKSESTQIIADPSAFVGCVGALPSGCGLANNGYAVEIAAGANDIVRINHVVMQMGTGGGIGALKLASGGQTQIAYDTFRGNGAVSTPIILMAPNTPKIQSQVYFSNSDIGFNNMSDAGAGAVLVQPIGTNSLKLHFNHVQVHNASFGVRTDGSLLSSGAVVASFVSECEFFSFTNAAMNAFSTSDAGTVNAVFDFDRILNAGTAIKANGPQSFVVLTNNTAGGNVVGIQELNGAIIFTSGNNTISGNGTNISGSPTPAATR